MFSELADVESVSSGSVVDSDRKLDITRDSAVFVECAVYVFGLHGESKWNSGNSVVFDEAGVNKSSSCSAVDECLGANFSSRVVDGDGDMHAEIFNVGDEHRSDAESRRDCRREILLI